MTIKYIFKAVKFSSLYGVTFLSFNYCEWFIATFITLFALLALTMQKEETEESWLKYINEEE